MGLVIVMRGTIVNASHRWPGRPTRHPAEKALVRRTRVGSGPGRASCSYRGGRCVPAPEPVACRGTWAALRQYEILSEGRPGRALDFFEDAIWSPWCPQRAVGCCLVLWWPLELEGAACPVHGTLTCALGLVCPPPHLLYPCWEAPTGECRAMVYLIAAQGPLALPRVSPPSPGAPPCTVPAPSSPQPPSHCASGFLG